MLLLEKCRTFGIRIAMFSKVL